MTTGLARTTPHDDHGHADTVQAIADFVKLYDAGTVVCGPRQSGQ